MDFFDCNAYLGLPVEPQPQPIYGTAEFVRAMDAAGVGRALVWHIAQYEYSALEGNRMLAEEIAPYQNLLGCWAILPDNTGELPPPREFFARMKANRIVALRAFPATQQFFLDKLYCGGLLGEITERRIPMLLSVGRGMDYGAVRALLGQYEKLTCVICDHGFMDRHFYTLLDRYPNLHIDTSFHRHQGAIEPLAGRFGAERILYGSGFPELGFGSAKYVIERAELSEEDRGLIAGGTLQRLISEAEL